MVVQYYECTCLLRRFHWHFTKTHKTVLSVSDMDTPVSSETGKQTICTFYLENRCRFADQCFNLHPQHDKPSNDPAEVRSSDVIHRILWDKALDPSTFYVAYTDRFIGLVSVPLTEFVSRNDPDASSDASIPQHRIQQIFYLTNENIVWDRQSKTDRVFGSTGFNGSILDFISNISLNQDNN